MDESQYPNNFRTLTNEQVCDLAAAVREDFGGNLPRADFAESLLLLLEDVPGFEMGGGADEGFIELAWTTYSGRPPNS
ncbi:MAG: hypothetical protein ACN6QT_33630 [Burkholderia contaminans]|jgi:hypothetical protein|uniref:Uncharacterized protein n=1 Tax=Burkholderia contaminans TaxID=488447 RepID=A0AAP4R2A4_9BURK|nr:MULTISPECIES: hypothetical protein [Burkholderia]MBD1411415.1 hypothetical protein [Burkholderia contaminans]MBM6428745.1 hypothetical protein [Burkholderia contaminans]MCA7876905.1 hypothetical protein [Burkholderia contaminans]MDN7564549.1 hypothetical protein [Burkholderia contaminans]MDN8020724.1 hypothetical protein [Burkholderia contaminans]